MLVYVCVREGWVGVGRDKQNKIERERESEKDTFSERELHDEIK